MTPGSNGDRRKPPALTDAQRARQMERFVGRVEDLIWASCVSCQRKTRGPVCEAYPDGIPEAILHRTVDHKSLFPGDHGLTYSASGYGDPLKLAQMVQRSLPGCRRVAADQRRSPRRVCEATL